MREACVLLVHLLLLDNVFGFVCGGVDTHRNQRRLVVSHAKAKKKGKGGGGGGPSTYKGFSAVTKEKKKGNGSSGAAGVLIRDGMMESLYSWLDERGVNMNKLAVADFDGLRGVIALQDIAKGSCILEVPYEASLNLGVDSGDPRMPALELLKVWSDPEWAPYMASLPPPDSPDLTTTDFWTQEELDMSQWPALKEETLSRVGKCHELYENVILPQIELGSFHGKKVTMQELKWAVFNVVSRTFTVANPSDSTRSAKLLIPAIDMFNHDAASPHVLTGRATSGGKLRVVAGESVARGSQVFIAYSGGTATSERLVQDYGFIAQSGSWQQDVAVAKKALANGNLAEDLQATTVEEDEKLLTSDEQGLSPCGKLAVEFRMQMKKALREASS